MHTCLKHHEDVFTVLIAQLRRKHSILIGPKISDADTYCYVNLHSVGLLVLQKIESSGLDGGGTLLGLCRDYADSYLIQHFAFIYIKIG